MDKTLVEFDVSDVSDVEWIIKQIETHNRSIMDRIDRERSNLIEIENQKLAQVRADRNKITTKLTSGAWQEDLDAIQAPYKKEVVVREKFLWFRRITEIVIDHRAIVDDINSIKQKLMEIDGVFWRWVFDQYKSWMPDTIRVEGLRWLVEYANLHDRNVWKDPKFYYPSELAKEYRYWGQHERLMVGGHRQLEKFIGMDNRSGLMPIDELNHIRKLRQIAKDIENGTFNPAV